MWAVVLVVLAMTPLALAPPPADSLRGHGRRRHALLAGPFEPVESPLRAMTDEAPRRFLRARRPFLGDGEFTLFELVLGPGAPVVVRHPDPASACGPVIELAFHDGGIRGRRPAPTPGTTSR